MEFKDLRPGNHEYNLIRCTFPYSMKTYEQLQTTEKTYRIRKKENAKWDNL